MDLVFKRRAVYTALRSHLDDQALVKALTVWDADYSEQSRFSFTAFLAVVCYTAELKRKRTRILSSLLKAMESEEAALLPDPYDSSTQHYEIAEPREHLENNTTIVFKRFLEQLIERLEKRNALNVRTYIIQHAGDLKVSAAARVQLCEWLNQKTHVLSEQYDLESLRKVINFAYIALCELVGPVKTDQLLSQTSAEVEDFANNKQVSLHDFL